jgi:myo-inositol catabolism protein IolH
VCVFGWEEDADAIHIRMRERLEAEFAGRPAPQNVSKS